MNHNIPRRVAEKMPWITVVVAAGGFALAGCGSSVKKVSGGEKVASNTPVLTNTNPNHTTTKQASSAETTPVTSEHNSSNTCTVGLEGFNVAATLSKPETPEQALIDALPPGAMFGSFKNPNNQSDPNNEVKISSEQIIEGIEDGKADIVTGEYWNTHQPGAAIDKSADLPLKKVITPQDAPSGIVAIFDKC